MRAAGAAGGAKVGGARLIGKEQDSGSDSSELTNSDPPCWSPLLLRGPLLVDGGATVVHEHSRLLCTLAPATCTYCPRVAADQHAWGGVSPTPLCWGASRCGGIASRCIGDFDQACDVQACEMDMRLYLVRVARPPARVTVVLLRQRPLHGRCTSWRVPQVVRQALLTR